MCVCVGGGGVGWSSDLQDKADDFLVKYKAKSVHTTCKCVCVCGVGWSSGISYHVSLSVFQNSFQFCNNDILTPQNQNQTDYYRIMLVVQAGSDLVS